MVLSGREILGLAMQTLVGTPVDPTDLIPVLPGTFRASEDYAQILDQGRRGPDAMDFAAVQGVAITNVTWEGNVAENNTDGQSIGHLINNILGMGTYTPTVFSSTNYEHLLRLGTAKEYLTLEHVLLRGSTVDRQIPACRVTEVTIRFDAAEGAVTYSTNLVGRKVIKVEEDTVEALTDNEGQLFRGWEGDVMLTGTEGDGFSADTAARLISGEFTLRRGSNPFYSITDSQDFADLYLEPLEVVASLVFDYAAVTELDYVRDKTQGPLAVRFTRGSGATERTFAIGGALWDWGDGPAELDNSGANVRLQVDARGLYSTANGPLSALGAATADAQNGPVEVYIAQPVSSQY